MELTFEILVETEKSKEELMEILQEKIEGTVRQKGYLLLQNNVLKIEENPLHDKSRLGAGEDSWSYFKYSVSVFPQNETTIEEQKLLARKISNFLIEVAQQVELIAGSDFE